MLCEYCHGTISSGMLSCPHCGAANPGYRETRNTTVNNTTHITNNNVTINNYYGSPRTKKVTSVQKRQQQELDNDWVLSFFYSFVYSLIIFFLFFGSDDLAFLFFIPFYLLNVVANRILFSILNKFNANETAKRVFCAVISVLLGFASYRVLFT